MRFYGNNIETIGIDYLLKATPFSKNTRINFNKQLTEDIFFNYLYLDRLKKEEDIEIKKENDLFDNYINEVISQKENMFAKVDLLHIYGYGGCGKTTYIRKLLRDNYKSSVHEYHIIDFEGCKKNELDPIDMTVHNDYAINYNTICEPFISTISKEIFLIRNTAKDFIEFVNSFNHHKFALPIKYIVDFFNSEINPNTNIDNSSDIEKNFSICNLNTNLKDLYIFYWYLISIYYCLITSIRQQKVLFLFLIMPTLYQILINKDIYSTQ